MKKLFKNKQLWGGLIAIFLLWFCLKSVTLSDIESLGQKIKLEYLIPSIACSFLFIIFRALRWRVMVSQQEKCGAIRIITLFSAGQVVNMAMPVLTGQVGRLLLYAKKLGQRKSFVFSTMVLEVVFDALSLLIFMFFTSLAFAFPSEYRFASVLVAIGTTIILILMYLILNFQQKLEEVGKRRLAHRWPGLYITLKKFIRSFAKGINLLRSSQHMITSVVYSLLAWTAHMMCIWLLLKSFGLHLPVAAAAVVMIVNTIVLMVPITPGNAGTFEVAVSTSLGAFKIAQADAVLFAVALHLVDLIPIWVLGLFFFKQDKNAIAQLRQVPMDETIVDQMTEDGSVRDDDR
ncbi:MAG: lysylphosphatidylglycerol synthase transmembrane domain-containing protein [Candidatus Zixiibacteriota bacterium]